MSNYISREAICLTDFEITMCKGDYKELCKMILDKIANAPAADVRPVVLCRDCKRYQQSHYIDNHMECARSGVPVHSVDFCSFGEKREES